MADTRVHIPSHLLGLKRTLVSATVSAQLSLLRTWRQIGRRWAEVQEAPHHHCGSKILKEQEKLWDERRASGEERKIVRHFEDILCQRFCVPATVLKKGQVAHEAGTGSLWHILRLDHTGYAAMRKQKEVYTNTGVGSWACRRLCTHRVTCGLLLNPALPCSGESLLLTCSTSPTHSYMLSRRQQGVPFPLLLVSTQPVSYLPRAIRRTRMIRMMVGLMGRAALISISSSVMPMTDSSTMARSSWFHLYSREVEAGVRIGVGGGEHSSSDTPEWKADSQCFTLLWGPLECVNTLPSTHPLWCQ